MIRSLVFSLAVTVLLAGAANQGASRFEITSEHRFDST